MNCELKNITASCMQITEGEISEGEIKKKKKKSEDMMLFPLRLMGTRLDFHCSWSVPYQAMIIKTKMAFSKSPEARVLCLQVISCHFKAE